MRTKERDEQFRSFYAAEADSIHRLALFMTGDYDRSADLAQEALLRAYRAWARIREEDPGPYVRKTLVNLVRNDYRKRMTEWRHREEPPPPFEDPGPRVDEALRVAEVLKALSPIRRAVVVLRFYEDLPEAEIARILDRPIGTIKSDLHRALKRLRPMLHDNPSSPHPSAPDRREGGPPRRRRPAPEENG
jgi:RNA polymerase sigma-70 factor (sigma-E family)